MHDMACVIGCLGSFGCGLIAGVAMFQSWKDGYRSGFRHGARPNPSQISSLPVRKHDHDTVPATGFPYSPDTEEISLIEDAGVGVIEVELPEVRAFVGETAQASALPKPRCPKCGWVLLPTRPCLCGDPPGTSGDR